MPNEQSNQSVSIAIKVMILTAKLQELEWHLTERRNGQMPCVNCGCNKDQHEYQRDGGFGSGQCKVVKHHGKCKMYRSPR